MQPCVVCATKVAGVVVSLCAVGAAVFAARQLALLLPLVQLVLSSADVAADVGAVVDCRAARVCAVARPVCVAVAAYAVLHVALL